MSSLSLMWCALIIVGVKAWLKDCYRSFVDPAAEQHLASHKEEGNSFSFSCIKQVHLRKDYLIFPRAHNKTSILLISIFNKTVILC